MNRIIGLLVAGTFVAATIPAAGAATAAQAAASTAAPPSQASTSPAPTPRTGAHQATLTRKRIEALQTELNGTGEQLTIDGIWGRKTETALRNFQEKHGLKATGRADAATLQQLNM